MARLKVFRATNGLSASYVAVSSKAKALEAWGTKQDLFKEGLAAEVTDPAEAAPALARPGEVVTRSALDPDAVEAALAALPKPKKGPLKKGAEKPAVKKRGPSREALERVAKLERKMAENDRAERERLADLAGRRAALDAEETEARGLAARRRRELDEKLAAARTALETEA